METLILRNPTKTKMKSLKAFLEALEIDFSFATEEKSPYNAEFVKKIKAGQRQIKEGKTTEVRSEEFKSFLGLG